MKSVVDKITDFADERERIMILTLSRVGEEFVNLARSTKTYKDRTGNLRSSIGYVVVKEGKIVKKDLKGKVAGKNKANEFVQGIINAEKADGFMLICFAGMEYAAAVESRNFDVITDSVMPTAELLEFFKKELGCTK